MGGEWQGETPWGGEVALECEGEREEAPWEGKRGASGEEER